MANLLNLKLNLSLNGVNSDANPVSIDDVDLTTLTDKERIAIAEFITGDVLTKKDVADIEFITYEDIMTIAETRTVTDESVVEFVVNDMESNDDKFDKTKDIVIINENTANAYSMGKANAENDGLDVSSLTNDVTVFLENAGYKVYQSVKDYILKEGGYYADDDVIVANNGSSPVSIDKTIIGIQNGTIDYRSVATEIELINIKDTLITSDNTAILNYFEEYYSGLDTNAIVIDNTCYVAKRIFTSLGLSIAEVDSNDEPVYDIPGIIESGENICVIISSNVIPNIVKVGDYYYRAVINDDNFKLIKFA